MNRVPGSFRFWRGMNPATKPRTWPRWASQDLPRESPRTSLSKYATRLFVRSSGASKLRSTLPWCRWGGSRGSSKSCTTTSSSCDPGG
eukprot:scaffold1954_cov268-Pinguiococcus_pyrenoidosus.AAC.28